MSESHPEVVEDAARYVIFLVDADKLFDTALGMYDFSLVLLIAQFSQKVPFGLSSPAPAIRLSDSHACFFAPLRTLANTSLSCASFVVCPRPISASGSTSTSSVTRAHCKTSHGQVVSGLARQSSLWKGTGCLCWHVDCGRRGVANGRCVHVDTEKRRKKELTVL